MSAIDKLRELELLPEEVDLCIAATAHMDEFDGTNTLDALEALAAVALEQANEVQRTQSDMREGFGGWVKEKARADDLATTLQGTLTSLAAASEENDQWEVEIALVMRERNEAEAMLNKAKTYAPNALWWEIHDWYARRTGGK
jgi:hypothetical protein